MDERNDGMSGSECKSGVKVTAGWLEGLQGPTRAPVGGEDRPGGEGQQEWDSEAIPYMREDLQGPTGNRPELLVRGV